MHESEPSHVLYNLFQFIVIQVAALAYRLNQRDNKIQKVLGFYFRAKQVDKVVVELLQQCGLSVSYSSTNSRIPDLTKKILSDAAALVKFCPFVMMHDNICIPFPVSSQRGDHQSTTDNRTSISIIFLPAEVLAVFNNPPGYQQLKNSLLLQRITGTAPQLSALDLDDDSRKKRLRIHRVHHVIEVLCALAAGSGSRTALFDHNTLQQPSGIHTLPHGKEHRTEQTMLKTVNIDETSHGGNDQVILNALSQLDFTPLESRKELTERIVGWVGDEMTVHRCKGIQQFCQEDPNSFDRLDPSVFIPGLFHTLMALGSSVFECHRGSSTGSGFAHDTPLLSHVGLAENMRKKRPDFHTNDKILHHELEARITLLWMSHTGAESLTDLLMWISDPARTPAGSLHPGDATP